MGKTADNIILERIAEAEACSIITLIKRGEDIEEVSAFFDVPGPQIDTVLTGNYGVIIVPEGVFERFVSGNDTDNKTLLQIRILWGEYIQEKGIEADFLSKEELSKFFSYLESAWVKLYENRNED